MEFKKQTLLAITVVVATSTTFSGCTKPRQTTAVSSAAGGAIGAGLGAIVGNQTGNPGSGLAIGAVAGAATGALIGNAIQEQQEKVAKQSESLKRQEQTLRAQRSEIDELRRMQSDSSYTASRAATVNAYLVEQKRLQLQRRGPSPKGEVIAPYAPPPLSVRSREPLARYDVKKGPIAEEKITLPPVAQSPKASMLEANLHPVQPNPAPASSAPIQAQPVKSSSVKIKPELPTTESITAVRERDLASAAAIKSEADRTAPANIEKKTETKAAPSVTQKDQPTTQGDVAKVSAPVTQRESCPQGREAKEAAANATENADKLFHLRKALRVCPNSAEMHYELGNIYRKMDRAADANYEFKQALSLDPNLTVAQESLKELDTAQTHY